MGKLTINEATEEMQKLNNEIKRLLKSFGGYEGEQLAYNPDNLDDDFIRSQYLSILYKLNDIQRRIEYLSMPVTEQGIIKHNSLGRYELPSGFYFTSGSVCEILKEDHDDKYWVYTSIEHNGEDYYATALGKNVSIDGKTVRIRYKYA
ncbi:MAG: DUF5348 domain-containing protein [Caldibacillus thermoamylovorans]|uniref:DUF5348 domain-containing protein n=1 Tax=Caldifermentibacillus hisashii TaxID=996558 RepID=UPI0031B74155